MSTYHGLGHDQGLGQDHDLDHDVCHDHALFLVLCLLCGFYPCLDLYQVVDHGHDLGLGLDCDLGP